MQIPKAHESVQKEADTAVPASFCTLSLGYNLIHYFGGIVRTV